MELIEKEKIKAEIERIKKLIDDNRFLSEFEKGCNQGREEVCDDLIDFINSLQAEPVSEELEEEITRYFSKNPIKHPTDWPALKNTALHFANWQKEQMTAKAIDGEVHKMGNIAYIKETSQDAIQGALKDFADRDKVKLIIIKED